MEEMKDYVGLKRIKATPLTRGKYNQLRGWDLPADENGDDEGYLVGYPDGGKANTDIFPYYVSWSPKDVFDESHREISNLPFSVVFELLKKDSSTKIQRSGWNGRGLFVTMKEVDGISNVLLVLSAPDGRLNTWVPSITDILADDWSIIG